jgi:hypothetical protein
MDLKDNIRNDEITNLITGGALELTRIDTSECAFISEDGVCASAEIKDVYDIFSKEFLHTTAKRAQIDGQGSDFSILGCNGSESCILQKKEFVNFAKKHGITESKIKEELETRFKPEGPRDSLSLIDNYNIADVQGQWMREYPKFYAFEFAMIDFDETNHPLYTTNITTLITGDKYNCFGCVLNTDFSSGRGKHWICVFVDCRSIDWTIEFYNSTGRPPARSILRWMEKTYKDLKEYSGLEPQRVIVTTVKHQQKNTECGVYALYYIRKRLEGESYTYFMKDRISDDEVSQFRLYLFR